jgi:hypothetical protein
VTAEESGIRYYPKEDDIFTFLMKRFESTVKQVRQGMLLSADERQILRAADYLNRYVQRREFIQMLAPVDTEF